MSWIIRDRKTGQVFLETFSRAAADIVNNTEQLEAVPVRQHLAELNAKIKAENSA